MGRPLPPPRSISRKLHWEQKWDSIPDIPIWDAGIPSGNLMCCAVMLHSCSDGADLEPDSQNYRSCPKATCLHNCTGTAYLVSSFRVTCRWTEQWPPILPVFPDNRELKVAKELKLLISFGGRELLRSESEMDLKDVILLVWKAEEGTSTIGG